MFLPVRGPSQGRVIPEGSAGNASELQDLLLEFLTAHRDAGPALRAAYAGQPGDLGAAFRSLGREDQARLREVYGAEAVRVLLNLAQETDRDLFFSDLFHLGRNYENQHHYALAASVNELVSQQAPGEKLRRVAALRNQVVLGDGPLGDHLEFLSAQFMEQLTDPALFAGMFAAGWTYAKVSSWARTSMASRTWAARALACGLGFGAEVPAFAFTVRGIREGQGLAQDWSAGGVSRDLFRTGIMLAFLKGAGAASGELLGSLSQRGSSPGWLRFSHRALPQLFQYAGLLSAHGVEQYWGLSTPTAHPWVDSLVTLLHFNVVGRAMNAVSRPNPEGLFGSGEAFRLVFHGAKEWLEQGPSQAELSTPEGLRVPSQIFNMSNEGNEGTGRPNPQGGQREVLESQALQGSESGPKQDRYLPPMKFNPRHFEAVRDRYYTAGNGLYTLIDAQEGIPLWYFQFRSMGLQFQALARRVREGLEGHPDGEEIFPVLRRIDQEMTEFNRLLLASPQAFPVVMTKSRVDDLASLLYPNPNVMVNFIHAGRRTEIEQVLRATARARDHLQGMLEGIKPWNTPEPDDAQVLARDLIPDDAGQFNRQYPKYDFSDDVSVLHHDVAGRGNSILLLGAKSEFRPTVFTDQRATHFGMRLLRSGEVPELYRTLNGDASAAPQGSFDFLEAYDLLRPEVIRSPEGEAVMEHLASRLKPGGVGYLVHRDGQALIGMAELLSRLQLGDIIEGSLDSPLPVAASRRDADFSNYLFFRRLPFK